MNESLRDVLRNNLAWLKRDAESTSELYRSVLTTLASSISKSATLPSPSEAKAVFSEVFPMDTELFAQFCEILTKGISDDREAHAVSSVSYVRSQVTDRAFAVFSAENTSVTASYGADFRTVCEDVYYERSDACILPLESSEDGLLTSFMKLILKYELWIHDVYRCRTEDDSFVTLALLTASPDSTGDVFELYLPDSAKLTPEDMCGVIRVFKGNVLRLSTAAYSGGCDIHASVRIPEEKITAMRFFLDAFCPSHMILGNYYNKF